MPLHMVPLPGEHLLRYVGDTLEVHLGMDPPHSPGWRAFLRTNLGRAPVLRKEVVSLAGGASGERTFAGASWRDLPMVPTPSGWYLHLPLLEVGAFRAKAFAVGPEGRQHWPEGRDISLSVHPNHLRTGNSVYCAFPRLMGRKPYEKAESAIQALDSLDYNVIPPSGTLRGLTRLLPHIFNDLQCRILHLLPIGPVPTTFARMGRFGSPYAQLDFTHIDPALVEFDPRATAEIQFQELVDGVHLRDGLLILDVVINHTGWGSRLMSEHPEWFHRGPDGAIQCPGAWGTIWGDLAELDPTFTGLWETVAEGLLVWCRRGVDGFRCDAGYMVPMPVWEYVLARVRQEFPETLFLLEGLGGAWEATAERLAGGMQWAYSELFQNYSAQEVSGYLDHAHAQGARLGALLHYSETHDNLRLAARGARWSLLRNRLSALTSQSGAWGFTSGVEWLATEKIDVHGASNLRWGQLPSLATELGDLNRLVSDHPCFFDGAKVERLSPTDSLVLALLRTSADGRDQGLVLINLDPDQEHALELKDASNVKHLGFEALGQSSPKIKPFGKHGLRFVLAPGWAGFLTSGPKSQSLHGEPYRTLRAQAAWALQCLEWKLPLEAMGPFAWQDLGSLSATDPAGFLAALPHVDALEASLNLLDAVRKAIERASSSFPTLVRWNAEDARRVTLVPPGHALLVEDDGPFTLHIETPGEPPLHLRSVPAGGRFFTAIPPRSAHQETPLALRMDRHLEPGHSIEAALRHLPERASLSIPGKAGLALLTNGRGGYARLHADLSHVTSKYDALLAANLDTSHPTERHVLAKRIRIWAIVDGFLTPLDSANLSTFSSGSPTRWEWAAHGGDGRCVALELRAWMPPGANTIHLCLSRLERPPAQGRTLPRAAEVRLTLRLDLEDRSHHGETEANEGLDAHFRNCTRQLQDRPGFAFEPAPDRGLRAWVSEPVPKPPCAALGAPGSSPQERRDEHSGSTRFEPDAAGDCPPPQPEGTAPGGRSAASAPLTYEPHGPAGPSLRSIPPDAVAAHGGFGTGSQAAFHLQPEWCLGIPHPLESTRGQRDRGDAWSPGWFECVVPAGGVVDLVVTADRDDGALEQPPTGLPSTDLETALRTALPAFFARRKGMTTVLAGYPWFLDWGRDALIACRGLLAAGCTEEALSVIQAFGGLERDGTLPNALFGADDANRESSDAPLWFALASQEAVVRLGPACLNASCGERSLREVLVSIAQGYLRGTPTGVRIDPETGLVWSPPHFTWMDTNHPAGSPREGYPVELQALWIRLLRFLEESGAPGGPWGDHAGRAETNLERYWREEGGFAADTLHAPPGTSASQAVPDDHLRPNQLWLVTLGLWRGERAQRLVQACGRHLLIPGALRSLAPLAVTFPLPIHSAGGQALNDPHRPYFGHYEGDEDTRRKPAYHNGTAWGWLLPLYAEALVAAWPGDAAALAAAKAILGSVTPLLATGCLGQLPEILDGDAPHLSRGCDAQAWSVTEALRVWLKLGSGAS